MIQQKQHLETFTAHPGLPSLNALSCLDIKLVKKRISLNTTDSHPERISISRVDYWKEHYAAMLRYPPCYGNSTCPNG